MNQQELLQLIEQAATGRSSALALSGNRAVSAKIAAIAGLTLTMAAIQ